MVLDNFDNTFSYYNKNERNWIERKLCAMNYIVIKKIDSENSELYFRNSTISYCNPPEDVFVRDITRDENIVCLPNNSYPLSSRRDYEITIGSELVFSLKGYTTWIVDKSFNSVYIDRLNP